MVLCDLLDCKGILSSGCNLHISSNPFHDKVTGTHCVCQKTALQPLMWDSRRVSVQLSVLGLLKVLDDVALIRH